MTMMMISSQFGLEDMEDLLWGPSSPMADTMDFLSLCLDHKEQEKGGGTSVEGDTSPVSPLTSLSPSSSSPPPFYSPPPTPPALLHGDKVRTEPNLFSLPLLGHPGQLRQTDLDFGKEDMLSDLDWMDERMNLNGFDLDSLIGSCSPIDAEPSSPEDFLASLDSPMELDSCPVSTLSTPVLPSLPSASPPHIPTSSPTPPLTVCSEPAVLTVEQPESNIEEQDVALFPVCVPEPQGELEIKSEPTSPAPSSPAYTLDLGSEVDVSESEEKPVLTPVIPQVQKVVLSLSPTRIVIVLSPKEEVAVTTTTTTTPKVLHTSHPPRSSRCRPYPEPTYKAGPPSPSASSVRVKPLRSIGEDNEERPAVKTSKVKKLKKMEQNKTAATRYRQKKKTEKEALLEDHAHLERKNMELKEKAESMAREIEYLKELIAEVRQARVKKGLSADT
uniref:Cyclic AMP-dependent transcription factor ATF-4 n=1 Tax=Mola mola TaxID=94237 RepID=A0A3Q3VLB0_MOLML